MSWPRNRSRAGTRRRSASSSATSSAARPSARSASSRSWSASRRSSSSRPISACANGSKAKSTSAGPRHSARASRNLSLATAGSAPLASTQEPLEPVHVEARRARRRAGSRPGRSRSCGRRAPCEAARRTSAGSWPPLPAADPPRDPRSAGRSRPARPRGATGSRAAHAASPPAAKHDGLRRAPRGAQGSETPWR